MTLLEQLRKPEEVKRWFDQIGDQAANEIESLQQQLIAAQQSKNACVIDLYRRLDLLDDLNEDLRTQLATVTGERDNLVEQCIRDDEWKAEAIQLPVQLQKQLDEAQNERQREHDKFVRVNNELEEAKQTIQKMKEALQDIANYGKDHDGCCPYGCDAPYIAQQTLAE